MPGGNWGALEVDKHAYATVQLLRKGDHTPLAPGARKKRTETLEYCDGMSALVGKQCLLTWISFQLKKKNKVVADGPSLTVLASQDSGIFESRSSGQLGKNATGQRPVIVDCAVNCTVCGSRLLLNLFGAALHVARDLN
jgi:hypothetical protein